MCGSLLGGQLVDRMGRRAVMLLSLIGGALLLWVVGAVENRWAFISAVGVFALVTDMYRPAASAMIADLVPVLKRPHAFARMYISLNLGFAIAPPIGGILAEFSFRWFFLGDAITMCLDGLIIFAFIPESLSGRATVGADLQLGLRVPIRRLISQIVADRTFVLLCTASLLMAIVFMQSMSTLPIPSRSRQRSSSCQTQAATAVAETRPLTRTRRQLLWRRIVRSIRATAAGRKRMTA